MLGEVLGNSHTLAHETALVFLGTLSAGGALELSADTTWSKSAGPARPWNAFNAIGRNSDPVAPRFRSGWIPLHLAEQRGTDRLRTHASLAGHALQRGSQLRDCATGVGGWMDVCIRRHPGLGRPAQ